MDRHRCARGSARRSNCPTATTSQSNRLGEASDIWRVQPRRTALFASHRFRYRGLIASLGGRLESWAPGRYVDDLVDSDASHHPADHPRGLPRRDVPDARPPLEGPLPAQAPRLASRCARTRCCSSTTGTRCACRTRRSSTPTSTRSTRTARSSATSATPTSARGGYLLRAGLPQPVHRQRRALVTAFWRDKYDFITAARVTLLDATGRETSRALRVNGDFARVRGLEVSYSKRIGRWFLGQLTGATPAPPASRPRTSEALRRPHPRRERGQHGRDAARVGPPARRQGVGDVHATTARRSSGIAGRSTASASSCRPRSAAASATRRSSSSATRSTRSRASATGARSTSTWHDPEARYSAASARRGGGSTSRAERRFAVVGTDLRFSLEVDEPLQPAQLVIINPVTGEAYPVDPEGTDFTTLRGDPATTCRATSATRATRTPRRPACRRSTPRASSRSVT